MNQSVLGSLRLLPICVIFAGCSKSNSDVKSTATSPTPPSATFTTDITKSPSYGQSVLYVQGNAASAYQFKPVNSLVAGTFVAWPAGISIDPKTGIIDASKSEPGSRYNVGFVSSVTGDTSYNQVIVDGVTYADGVYALDSKDSVLQPYYNTSSVTPWASDGKEAAFTGSFEHASKFGVAGPSGMSAVDQGLNVSKTDGTINLANSLRQGLFGSNPQNGDTKTVSIYYRLNDGSRHSLMHSTVVVHYYNTMADVPVSLLATAQASQRAFTGQGAVLSTGATTETDGTTPTTAPKAAVATAAPVAPRPPQVVLVVKGH